MILIIPKQIYRFNAMLTEIAELFSKYKQDNSKILKGIINYNRKNDFEK